MLCDVSSLLLLTAVRPILILPTFRENTPILKSTNLIALFSNVNNFKKKLPELEIVFHLSWLFLIEANSFNIYLILFFTTIQVDAIDFNISRCYFGLVLLRCVIFSTMAYGLFLLGLHLSLFLPDSIGYCPIVGPKWKQYYSKERTDTVTYTEWYQ